MPFKDQLQEKLKKQIPQDVLEKIPAGFQRIGQIIILNLDNTLQTYKKEIAQATLELFPTIKTVCNKTGGIVGQFREPQIEWLAGDKNTTVIHTESNCRYTFDVTKIMFAKGNLSERVRVPQQVKKGEIILDMFAGIGYFSIPLGKLSPAKKIYAVELNPNSVHFLQENIKLNKLSSVEPIHADNREVIKDLQEAHLYQIGQAMALLHSLPMPDYLPPTFPEGVEKWQAVAKNGQGEFIDWLRVRIDEYDKGLDTTLSRSIVHGDIFYDNVLFQDDKLAAIIDFEDVSNFYPPFDIGMGIIGSCQTNDHLNFQKASYLVKGYETVRPLSQQEKDSLQFFTKFAAVSLACWRYSVFNLRPQNSLNTNAYLQMVGFADQLGNMPASKFQSIVFNQK